jgi:bifunctional non-homologous end joining protein LigD
MEQTTLYYREGSSDKVYQAQIEPSGDGFKVTFAYGRRGSTLTAGTKTQQAVSYDAAKRIYDKLIQEKMAKGYTPGADGTPYQNTDKADQITGIHCQLLNPIGEEQVEHYLASNDYWLQEKFDGRRLLLHMKEGEIIGINRKGLAVPLPDTLLSDARQCSMDFTIDGEAIGDTLRVFDLLFISGEDVRPLRYLERYLRLLNLVGCFQHHHISIAETAYKPEEKRQMFDRLVGEKREGVVFKQIDAPYTAGRPASGGNQVKLKFYETASFIVGKINAKRSIGLLLARDGKMVEAGNVTIPPNHEIPAPGWIVECRYLYAFAESGCIYQPTYLGTRKDITEEECTAKQLKFKNGSEEVDDAT